MPSRHHTGQRPPAALAVAMAGLGMLLAPTAQADEPAEGHYAEARLFRHAAVATATAAPTALAMLSTAPLQKQDAPQLAQQQSQQQPPRRAPGGNSSGNGSHGDGRFDLSVNDAPAAQVFMQIAQGSPYTMLVSPEVTGRISISLKNTTVFEALEAMRDLHAYDFRINGTRITIQPNTMQTRMFRVNYLPGRRIGSSALKVTSSTISAPTNTPGQAANGQSAAPAGFGGASTQSTQSGRSDDTANVSTSSDADFWRDIKASLLVLLPGEQHKVVINSAAGVILVRALPAELRQVEQYLKAMQVNADRQVMIEAKILEVELSEDAQSGVNWSAFGKLLGRGIGMAVTRPGAVLQTSGVTGGTLSSDGVTITPGLGITASATGPGFYGLSFQSANFAAMLNFLETQGKVHVLSSPRIATINNQKAVLKVGSDELYVTGLSPSTTTSSTGTTTQSNMSVSAVFSGIALDVTPQIDADGMVMMHVHPSITTVRESPKSFGAANGTQLSTAITSVNETDSIVRVPDGQIVAIGGLMMQEQRKDTSAVPGLGDMPIFGGLFRQKAALNRKRELVILMRPTVIKDDGPWPDSQAAKALEAPPAPAQDALERTMR